MKGVWETVWRGNEFNGCFIDVFLLGYWNIFMGYDIKCTKSLHCINFIICMRNVWGFSPNAVTFSSYNDGSHFIWTEMTVKFKLWNIVLRSFTTIRK